MISTVTYNPATATMDQKFVFKTKVQVQTVTTPKDKDSNLLEAKAKTKKAMEAVVVPNTNIQIKLREDDSWGLFSAKMTESQLDVFQRDGGTFNVRIKASDTKKIVLSEDKKTASLADGTTAIRLAAVEGSENAKNKVEKTIVEDSARTMVRSGVPKIVKIARKAYGPAMVIDYANHAFTLKKGQEYNNTASATEPDTWKSFPSEITAKTVKAYFGTNGNVTTNTYYGLRMAVTSKAPASLTNFVEIPKDVALAETTIATISGGYGTAAAMKITKTAEANAVKAAEAALAGVTDPNEKMKKQLY